MGELPLREWVVIFYPTTGAARLCPTLDFAKNIAASVTTFNKHVYRSPRDFQVRHDHATLESCWRRLHKTVSWQMSGSAIGKIEDYSPEPPDCGTEAFSKLLWEFIQDVGDRLSAPRMVSDKTKEHYELKLGLMRDAVENGTVADTYNKQARTVFHALLNSGKQFLSESEIKQLIYRLVADRQLKTKQEPWVIFQYYRPQFIKDGYVIRGREPKNSRQE